MTESSFKLKFGSLSAGHHEFRMEMDQAFFQLREEALIEDGKVEVLCIVERAERHVKVEFKLSGQVARNCDNCLSSLLYPVHFEGVLHLKLTDKEMQDEVDIIHLPANAVEFDTSDYFYDSLVLSLPMRIVCKKALNREDCDPEVMKILKAQDDQDGEIHPELVKLKNLFNKN